VSERIAQDEPEPAVAADEHLTARERARAAAQAAKRGLAIPDDDEQPDPEEHGYGTPEHARQHHERHPNRVGQAPETRRRMAAADAMTEKEARDHARATGQICDTTGCYWPDKIHNHNPNGPHAPKPD
jgi:hypothetical protein